MVAVSSLYKVAPFRDNSAARRQRETITLLQKALRILITSGAFHPWTRIGYEASLLSRTINISGFHIRGTAGTASLITSARKRITSFWHFWREFRMPTFILGAVNILSGASDLFYLYLKLNILSRQRAHATLPSVKEAIKIQDDAFERQLTH